jgi:branched-chain amino acid transport system substrate-binding protein
MVIMLAGCPQKRTSQPSMPSGTQQRTLKVGCITPLTGDGASYGKQTKQGIDLAVEEINSAGGVNGAKLKVIYEDDQMKPQVGISAIQKLITVSMFEKSFFMRGKKRSISPLPRPNT